ncbi:hypothetical protein NECAME_09612 [Necator americanus]|uniref:Uncharacterized protein n=1 Tax=Necator americanus TaxID=51031 RepID=W2TDC8_NECAM|nr:hypothetical protein NECAME_09612 [Necator americanus]ETN79813.1 hypothetical protein NECAME_09612 [Necator americanus]
MNENAYFIHGPNAIPHPERFDQLPAHCSLKEVQEIIGESKIGHQSTKKPASNFRKPHSNLSAKRRLCITSKEKNEQVPS